MQNCLQNEWTLVRKIVCMSYFWRLSKFVMLPFTAWQNVNTPILVEDINVVVHLSDVTKEMDITKSSNYLSRSILDFIAVMLCCLMTYFF